jgi:hypothetical protein
MLCVLWQMELCVLATTCDDELGEPTLHSSQVYTHTFCMSNCKLLTLALSLFDRDIFLREWFSAIKCDSLTSNRTQLPYQKTNISNINWILPLNWLNGSTIRYVGVPINTNCFTDRGLQQWPGNYFARENTSSKTAAVNIYNRTGDGRTHTSTDTPKRIYEAK